VEKLVEQQGQQNVQEEEKEEVHLRHQSWPEQAETWIQAPSTSLFLQEEEVGLLSHCFVQ
jgi:hypothetical protein